jgi:hypothetical protein
MKGKCGNPGLKGKLIDKSIEAYILALEIINQLSVKYRVETFTYLICNAWELRLKAKLIETTSNWKTIYYPKKRSQPRRSLSLRDCLKTHFTNEKDPVRRNIECIETLRDNSTHLVISQVPKDVLGLFQACVLNYHNHLLTWFGISLSDRVPVGMMTIVFDFNPQEFDVQDAAMKKKLGKEAFQYISQFQAMVKKEFDDLGKPAEYSIDIGYKLGLVKNFKEGDIQLTQGTGGEMTGIVQVAKDPSVTHPYRRKDLVEKINTLIGDAKITPYDIDCVIKSFPVKNRPDFYYKGKVKGSPTQYSETFKEWLVTEHGKDNNFFAQIRQKVKEQAVKLIPETNDKPD